MASSTDEVSIAQNIIGYSYFLICGLVLNANWMLTTIAIIIDLIAALLFYPLSYDIADAGVII